jgi:enoyl-CoA hydratase
MATISVRSPTGTANPASPAGESGRPATGWPPLVERGGRRGAVPAEPSRLVLSRDEPLDHGTLRILTLNRPDKRNALDMATLVALSDLVHDAERDPGLCCLAVTGSGDAFSAGGDLEEFRSLRDDPSAFADYLSVFADLCRVIEVGGLPAIAAINGVCVAGGLELALAFDWIVAARSARIGDGHLVYGQVPGAGGVARLCARVGPAPARDLLLTGRLCGAPEARELGLVDRVFEYPDLMAGVRQIASQVAPHSRRAVATMKAMIAATLATADSALGAERTIAESYATSDPDARAGLEAFRARRRPPLHDA